MGVGAIAGAAKAAVGLLPPGRARGTRRHGPRLGIARPAQRPDQTVCAGEPRLDAGAADRTDRDRRDADPRRQTRGQTRAPDRARRGAGTCLGRTGTAGGGRRAAETGTRSFTAASPRGRFSSDRTTSRCRAAGADRSEAQAADPSGSRARRLGVRPRTDGRCLHLPGRRRSGWAAARRLCGRGAGRSASEEARRDPS